MQEPKSADFESVLYFYEKDKDYYEFTNFWDKNPITINGESWPTSEHYFQAQKFSEPALKKAIQTCKTPREAFDIAQKNAAKRDLNWLKGLADQAMKTALIEKFKNPMLRKKLLTTAGALLVEDSHLDQFWGVGADGKGENKLGLMLTALRETITDAKDDSEILTLMDKKYEALKIQMKGHNYGKPDKERQGKIIQVPKKKEELKQNKEEPDLHKEQQKEKKSEVQSVSNKKIPLDVFLDFLEEQARPNKHYAYLDRTTFKTSEVALLNYFNNTEGQISISYNEKENRLSYTSTSSSEESLWEMIRFLSEEIKQFGKPNQVQLKPADAEAKKIMEDACKHYGLKVSASVTAPSKEVNPMEEMMRQMQGQGMPKPPGKR